MNKTTLSLVLAAALTVTVLPAVAATHAGHTYEIENTIVPTAPGAYVTSQAHDYAIADVPAGTTITATLTWDDPTVDMALNVHGPSDSCDVAPEEDPECFVGILTSGIACDGATDPALPGDGERTATFTAEETADHEVSAQARLVGPMTSVPYELTITVDDAHGDLSGPTQTTYGHTSPHCGLVQ